MITRLSAGGSVAWSRRSVGSIDRRRFLTWSAVGAAGWVILITLMGYFLGRSFPGLGHNIDKAIIAILAVSLLPIVYEWWKHRRDQVASRS